MNKKYSLTLFFLFLFSFFYGQPPPVAGTGGLQLALKKLNVTGSVLYVAAHPDDENTRLLSFLANDRLLRTAYLSLTRGDGGQNLIGTEQSEALGLIRTQELLAARSIDGAEQFFTRANDFGYSKNPEETFGKWDKEKILADVVWVIRTFRPDVIITRFPENGDGGHGHHTASAILAREAFDAAADPQRFPEQLKYVQPWQAKRLFWNAWQPERDPKADLSKYIKLDVGGYNPLQGKSYGEIAAESRSMHKSQGFGVPRNRGSQTEYFNFLKGDKPGQDLFEGIDQHWTRIRGSEHAAQLLQQACKQFNAETPETILPTLMQAYQAIQTLSDTGWVEVKKKELEKIILACAGIYAEATANTHSVVPGSEMAVNAYLIKRRPASVEINGIRFLSEDTLFARQADDNLPLVVTRKILLSKETPYSQPYWLKEPHEQGRYTVSAQQLVGRPETPPALQVTFMLKIHNQPFMVHCPLMYKWTDPVEGEQYRSVEVVPPVTIQIPAKAFIFPDKEIKNIPVTVKAWSSNTSGTVSLSLPEGWISSPEKIPFTLSRKEEEMTAVFAVTPPANPSTGRMTAVVTTGEQTIRLNLHRIIHPHIPIQTYYSSSSAKTVRLDLHKKGKRIGYLMGAGDEIPACLTQAGYEVTLLKEAPGNDLSLKNFDAVVVGIRAYNTEERLKMWQKKLMDYTYNGGTLVVQYNTTGKLITDSIGPYPFTISRDRVSVEEAPVSFLNTSHPLLTTPNKITAADFEDWVQERGLYFAGEWAPQYETVLSCNDPGEEERKGGLLYAKYGQGVFIYSSYSWFRQLPEGVPGAYRLFANMLAGGK